MRSMTTKVKTAFICNYGVHSGSSRVVLSDFLVLSYSSYGLTIWGGTISLNYFPISLNFKLTMIRLETGGC